MFKQLKLLNFFCKRSFAWQAFILGSFLIFAPLNIHAQEAGLEEHSNSYNNFMKSNLLALQKNSDSSQNALERALRQDPQSHYLKLKLARVLASKNEFARAKSLSKEVLKENPQKAEAHLVLGQIESLIGNQKQAKRHFIMCRNAEPLNEDCVILLARQETLEKSPETAIKILHQYLKNKPDSTDARFILAGLYGKGENFKNQLEELLRYNPSFLPAHLGLARHYEKAGDKNLALNHYLKVAHYQEESRVVYLKIGLIYYELKDLKKAAQYFKKAKELGNQSEQVTYYLGLLYGMQGDYKQAAQLLEEIPLDSALALESVPALSSAYYQLGKKGKIRSLLKKSLKLYPRSEKLWEVYISYYMNESHYKRAYKLNQEALRIFPQNKKFLLNQAVLLDKLGQYKEAFHLAQTLLQKEPEDPSLLNFVGYSYAEQGKNLALALELLEKAHQLKPKSGYILDSLAWAYYQNSQVDKALDLTLRANQISPNEAIIQEHLGEIYFKLGEKEKAREYFEKAYENIRKIKKPSQRDKSDQKRIRQRYLETRQ